MNYTGGKHFTHDHALSPQSDETPFRCNGCMEPGWGPRFRCSEGCNFILHKDCATAEERLNHPFHNSCSLRLRKRGFAGNCCCACGKPALGLVYYGGGYTLHPVCATLSRVLEQRGVTLHLQECVQTTRCCRCGESNIWGKKNKGWSYRSTCKKYHLHVSCVKDMLQRYVIEKWEREHLCTNMDISSVPDLLPNHGSSSSSSGSKYKKIALQVLALVLNVVFSTLLGQALQITFFS